MKIEGLGIEELMSLRIQLERAIKLHYKNEMDKKIYLIDYATELVSYISAELGYDITARIRKTTHTFARYVLIEHLRSKAMGLENIGRCLNITHATVIHGSEVAEILTNANDAEFMLMKIKINHLITLKNDNNGEQKFIKSIGKFSKQN